MLIRCVSGLFFFFLLRNSCDPAGHNVPTKATSNGTMCANGSLGTEGPEATETDASGTGGCGSRWRGMAQRRTTLFTSREGKDLSIVFAK